MKLQLNTGKTLNFWFIPETLDFATGFGNGQTALIGPSSLTLESINSLLLINISILATASTVPTIDLNIINLKLIRNNDSANPIVDQDFSYPPGQAENYITVQIIDDMNTLNTPITEDVTYTLALTVNFIDPITTSFSIITINFSEIDTPTELPLVTSSS